MKKKIILVLVLILVAIIAITGIDAFRMKKAAGELKSNVVVMANSIMSGDTDKAREAYISASLNANTISKKLDNPNWLWFSYGRDFIAIWNDASVNLIEPGLDVVEKNPLSTIKVGDGINVKAASAYLDFLEAKDADLENLINSLSNLSPKWNELFGLSAYIEKIDSVKELYPSVEKYLPFIRAFIGNGEDRTYLFAAQNSAEIRASGGFPGSASVIRIRDGILTIDEFQGISPILPLRMPKECNVTSAENSLFGGWLTLQRDACYVPDFERVAFMWKVGYESIHEETLDGVVTAIPTVVQKLLAILGTSVSLSDGRTIDGTNAVKVIEKDIYYDYFQVSNYTSESNAKTDALFSEAAKKTFELAKSSFSVSQLDEYIEMFEGCFANREVMVWLADENSQQIVRDLGCSGALNYDANSPKAGVYFSCSDPGRLGLYVNMNTSMSEGRKNADGTMSYDITVTLNNSIEPEIVKNATSTIVGHYRGAILSYIYLFAPYGGSISNITASNGMTFNKTTYDDLQVYSRIDFFIYPAKEIKITYTVTTAKGVTTQLEFDKTPTLQDYLK